MTAGPPAGPSPRGLPTSTVLDWRVYADATCAGLAVLIPVPLADLAVERFFRRRMPRTIARVRGVEVSPRRLAVLVAGEPWISLGGCLTAPFVAVLWLLKRISRKILYFLTVNEACEQLSFYWHTAHLVDHVIAVGELSGTDEQARACARRVREVLAEVDTRPLVGLARTVIEETRRHVGRLFAARRTGADVATREEEAVVRRHWSDVAAHLARVVERYDELAVSEGPVGRAGGTTSRAGEGSL